MSKEFSCYAVVAPGLEESCRRELQRLGMAASTGDESGGVSFGGALRELYRANLHLRTASRILVRVGECGARDFPDLYRKAIKLPWGSYIRPGGGVRIRVTSHRSRLVHSGRIAETVTAAISHALGQAVPAPENGGAEQLVLVRMVDDRCQFSVDSSGEHLHCRGYRLAGGAAPLRETLAAGLLLLLDWHGDVPLLDPLCGSGTIAIEAALMAAAIPPGGRRAFAFMQWPGYRAGLWQVLCAEAERERRTPQGMLAASDHDPTVIALARQNAERAGVGSLIDISVRDMATLPVCAGPRLILCNPPYGERLGEKRDLLGFYRTLGEGCRRAFPDGRLALLAPEERVARATGWPLRCLAQLNNGGIPLGFYASED